MFEDYIRDNVVSWFEWSKKMSLGVERMEDLILVTGCTLATSWAAVAFLDRSGTAEISLVHMPHEGEGCFAFSNIRGDVARHCGGNVPVSSPCYLRSLSTNFFLKDKFNHTSESMHLHQGPPSKASSLPDRGLP